MAEKQLTEGRKGLLAKSDSQSLLHMTSFSKPNQQSLSHAYAPSAAAVWQELMPEGTQTSQP
jgi:hypothetical protein